MPFISNNLYVWEHPNTGKNKICSARCSLVQEGRARCMPYRTHCVNAL